MRDSSLDNQDNLQDNQQNQQDTVYRKDTKKENFEKISISELLKKYRIGRNPLYNRMTYLKIKTWKVCGKAYLDTEQVAQMDGLHEHIQVTGRMEGYPVPPPSGPVDTCESTSALAVVESEESTPTTMKPEPNYATSETRQTHTQDLESVNQLIESAQGKAAGVMIAENMLARQYLQNPQLLPEELKKKIKESAEVPKIDPFAYAESLIKLAQI
jgi:hypothetical protein